MPARRSSARVGSAPLLATADLVRDVSEEGRLPLGELLMEIVESAYAIDDPEVDAQAVLTRFGSRVERSPWLGRGLPRFSRTSLARATEGRVMALQRSRETCAEGLSRASPRRVGGAQERPGSG
jgi:hypothetical protein